MIEFNRFSEQISEAKDYFYERINNRRTIREVVEIVNDLCKEEVAIFYGQGNSGSDSGITKQRTNNNSDREVIGNNEQEFLKQLKEIEDTLSTN